MPDPPPTVLGRDSDGNPKGVSYQIKKGAREGGYLAGAMINAYFSRTEYILLFALPFLGFNPSDGALLKFIELPWTQKIRAIFDLSKDADANRLHERMINIRRAYRNPLAHGGMEQGGASLFFHLPEVGAIPIQLTSCRSNNVDFYFSSVPIVEFANIIYLFDEFDKLLRSRSTRYGFRYAESGISLSFDQPSLEECRLASEKEDEFEAMLDKRGYWQDMHANMDY